MRSLFKAKDEILFGISFSFAIVAAMLLGFSPIVYLLFSDGLAKLLICHYKKDPAFIPQLQRWAAPHFLFDSLAFLRLSEVGKKLG